MTKTAAVILSSPRKGSNSNALGLAVAEGFRWAGGQTEILDLFGLDIRQCLGCDSCQRNGGRCSQVDGMNAVYPKLKQAAVIVLATPVYMFSMSGQLKNFLDRCYALINKEGNALAGKTVAAAISFGAPDLDSSGAGNVVQVLQDICRYTQSAWGGFVHGWGQERDTLAKDEAALRSARELGQKLYL